MEEESTISLFWIALIRDSLSNRQIDNSANLSLPSHDSSHYCSLENVWHLINTKCCQIEWLADTEKIKLFLSNISTINNHQSKFIKSPKIHHDMLLAQDIRQLKSIFFQCKKNHLPFSRFYRHQSESIVLS